MMIHWEDVSKVKRNSVQWAHSPSTEKVLLFAPLTPSGLAVGGLYPPEEGDEEEEGPLCSCVLTFVCIVVI